MIGTELPPQQCNLWGGHEVTLSVVKRIVENVDVLVGNEGDLQMGLGISGPEVAATSKLDPQALGMIDRGRPCTHRSRSWRPPSLIWQNEGGNG